MPKVFWTILFAVISSVFAGLATESVYAGLSVFFGLWAVAGMIESIHQL